MVDVVVDTREVNAKANAALIPDLKDLGLSVDKQQLDVGDYILYDAEGEISLVTRKAGDLYASIFDGHFADELNRCMKLIESLGGRGKLFWIQEGLWSTAYPDGGKGGMDYFKRSGPKWFRSTFHNGSSEKVFSNVQLSLTMAGIVFLSTGTLHETALMLAAIHERGQQGWPSKLTSSLRRPQLRWSEDSRVQRLMSIWPHLREASATALIHEFSSVFYIVSMAMHPSDYKKLLAVKGVGQQGLSNFQEALR